MPTPFCYGSTGNAHFLRSVGDALDQTLDGFFSEPDWTQDTNLPARLAPEFQALSGRPQAFGTLEVAGAFAMFLVSCFGKKVFDEFYDRLLKRPLAPFIDRLCRTGGNDKAVEIRDVVYLSDIDLTVVVSAITTAEEAGNTARLFLQAHRVAHTYIEKHGKKAPVHLHSIVEGRIALEPELLASLKPLPRNPR